MSTKLEPKQAIVLVAGGLTAFVALVTVIVYAGDALHFAARKAGQARTVVEARIRPSPTPWPTETATPAPSPTATQRPMVTVNVVALNVRADPGAGYERVGQVHEGDRLTVLARQKDGEGREWLKVRTRDGVEGWVAGWYTAE